jgi:hypothetical protein
MDFCGFRILPEMSARLGNPRRRGAVTHTWRPPYYSLTGPMGGALLARRDTLKVVVMCLRFSLEWASEVFLILLRLIAHFLMCILVLMLMTWASSPVPRPPCRWYQLLCMRRLRVGACSFWASSLGPKPVVAASYGGMWLALLGTSFVFVFLLGALRPASVARDIGVPVSSGRFYRTTLWQGRQLNG